MVFRVLKKKWGFTWAFNTLISDSFFKFFHISFEIDASKVWDVKPADEGGAYADARALQRPAIDVCDIAS